MRRQPASEDTIGLRPREAGVALSVEGEPPNNEEAEQSVLGSIMLDNEVYAQLEGTLTAEQF